MAFFVLSCILFKLVLMCLFNTYEGHGDPVRLIILMYRWTHLLGKFFLHIVQNLAYRLSFVSPKNCICWLNFLNSQMMNKIRQNLCILYLCIVYLHLYNAMDQHKQIAEHF